MNGLIARSTGMLPGWLKARPLTVPGEQPEAV